MIQAVTWVVAICSSKRFVVCETDNCLKIQMIKQGARLWQLRCWQKHGDDVVGSNDVTSEHLERSGPRRREEMNARFA